jgi:thioredoxin 1
MKQTVMAASNLLALTEESFTQEVLEASVPVLVDFWAEWCGPCKMIAPVIEELAGDYDGRVKFGKVNVDEQQNLAAQYGIRAVPTLLIFKTGSVVEQVVGLRSKRDLKANLDKYLVF